MIKQLRRKFVLIMMSIVTMILLVIFAIMLYSTNKNIERNSFNALRQSLRLESVRISAPPGGVSLEVPHNPPMKELRIPTLIAHVSGSGEITVDRNQIYFLAETEIPSIVATALDGEETAGELPGSNLRYYRQDASDGVRIAIADISMERSIVRDLVVNSLLVGSTALLLFFFVSILLARWAVRPVQEAWDRQRQFVADASHELKTPLTVILSNAQMLTDGHLSLDEKEARRMNNICAEGSRMKYLIDDLLTLAKSDDSLVSPVYALIDFSDVVTESILLFEPSVFDQNKRLEQDIQESLLVSGDAGQLRRIVDILLDNALKYSPANGKIEIALKALGKKNILLSVYNEGPPIPENALSAVFHRFYRVDESRSNHGGFGLGLSIAQSIVTEHGGRIWAQNTGSSGNTFFVSLPLKRSEG